MISLTDLISRISEFDFEKMINALNSIENYMKEKMDKKSEYQNLLM